MDNASDLFEKKTTSSSQLSNLPHVQTKSFLRFRDFQTSPPTKKKQIQETVCRRQKHAYRDMTFELLPFTYEEILVAAVTRRRWTWRTLHPTYRSRRNTAFHSKPHSFHWRETSLARSTGLLDPTGELADNRLIDNNHRSKSHAN